MPRRIEKKDLDNLSKYLGKPRKITEMMKHLGVSSKTAYRWIEELVRRGEGVYRIRTPGEQTGFSFFRNKST
jgi:transposase